MVKPAVLIVDDQHRSFRVLLRLISGDLFSPLWAADEQQGLKLLEANADRVRIILINQNSLRNGRRRVSTPGQEEGASHSDSDHRAPGNFPVSGR